MHANVIFLLVTVSINHSKNFYCSHLTNSFAILLKNNKMEKKIISAAAIFGMLAIVFGAFGAHALKEILTLQQQNSFETGVRYQMYHALFLLFVGANSSLSENAKSRILSFTSIGILFFSGSIYLLSTKDVTGLDFSLIGAITPLGGLLLIIAWLLLFIEYWKKKV